MIEVGGIFVLLGINFLLINLFFYLAIRWRIFDTPNERSSHQDITIRGGGILFPIAWLMFSLANEFAYPYVTVAILIVSAVSFIDDLKPQRPITRLIFHIISLLLVFNQFDLVFNNFLFLIPALILCIGILNAINFMDGINGITGLYFLVFLLSTLLFIADPSSIIESAISLDQPFIFLFTAMLVFGFYNFRKKAKTFAGDVGSVSVGLLIIVFLLTMGLGSRVENGGEPVQRIADFNWSVIFFLTIYGLDSILTIIRRILDGQNIFKAHREHLYQKLCNQLSWSHLTVALIYASAQLIINLFILNNQPSLVQLLIGGIGLMFLYIAVRKWVLKG